jgi:hypothetical protein
MRPVLVRAIEAGDDRSARSDEGVPHDPCVATVAEDQYLRLHVAFIGVPGVWP